MSSISAKTFDAVNMVRVVRDDVSSTIVTMSVEDENRWLRSAEFSDPKLRRLMELAARQGAPPDAAWRRG